MPEPTTPPSAPDDAPDDAALRAALVSALQPPRTDWASADDLRTRARRRHGRRRRGGITTVLAVAAAVALVAVVATQGGGAHHVASERVTGPLTYRVTVDGVASADGSLHLVADVTGRALPVARPDVAAATASAEVAFGLDLTRRLAATAGDGANTLDSPLSATLALAMLELGARGDTATGIARTLHTAALPATVQAAGWADLLASLGAVTPGVTLSLADSAWLQRSDPFVPGFLAELAQSFGNTAYQVDFARRTTAALHAIDGWAASQTHGQIPQLLGPSDLNPQTVFVLANALYFKAAWGPGVNMSDAAPERFRTGSGSVVDVAALNSGDDGEFPYASTPDYTAVALPYAGGRYEAELIEPTSTGLPAFLAGLDPARLAAIGASLRPTGVTLTMPALTLTASSQLGPDLEAMGMARAFRPEADLSGISPIPTQVGVVVQAAHLVVNRYGTTASAATGVTGIESAARVEVPVTIDRPYLYLLRDTRTGTVLMTAAVEDPAAG